MRHEAPGQGGSSGTRRQFSPTRNSTVPSRDVAVVMMDEVQSHDGEPSPPVFRRLPLGEPPSGTSDPLDGLDPRHEKRSRLAKSRRGKPDYAALRLAGEVASSLNLLLSSSADPELNGFAVASATPLGRGSHFLVQVYATDPAFRFDPVRVMASLSRAKSFFRQEIAGSVTRKYAPDFRFQLLPPGAQPL